MKMSMISTYPSNDDDEDDKYKIHLSTDRSRGVDNDHSKRGNQCEMQLLGEPSTVASNALELR